MRVRSGLYRSPHFSNDQSTPHSAALHTGLRSGHTSGVQDVNLFPSWMTLRLANGQNEAGEGFAEIEDGVGHGEEPLKPNSEVVGGVHWNFDHGSNFAKATTDRSHGLSRMKRIGNLKSQISNFKKEARSSS